MSGIGNGPAYYDQQFANARAQRMTNLQNQQNMQAQNEADSALPSILMGLTAGAQNLNTPAPGQPSVPSNNNGNSAGSPPVQTQQMSPMPQGGPPSNYNAGTSNSSGAFPSDPSQGGGPDISRISPPQPQQPPNPAATGGSQSGGYDLGTLINTIKQQYPNISGAAMRSILATVNPYLLTPAARIQMQRLGITQENADTNRLRADTGLSNNNVRQLTNFGQQQVPIPQPLLIPGQGAPQAGGPQPGPANTPGMPPGNTDAINALMENATKGSPGGGAPAPQQPPPAPSNQMSGGFGGTAPTAPIKGQNKEAEKNAELRTQYTASMQNDMQLHDNLDQLKTLLTNPNFGTGAAGDTRAQAAGIMYYITGDPKWNDAATVAQLDQKAMAGILVDQVSSLAASSGGASRSMATDLMKKYVSQMKPEMSKTPAANRSVVEGATGTLERNTLNKQFFSDITQKYGIYPQQAQQAVMKADQHYPLITINPNGSLQVNKDNIPKYAEALSQVSGNDYTSFALSNGQDHPDRELTSQETDEFNRRQAAIAAKKGGK